jgi:aryl-alcohol dehydrogenase-like predicted oxidoreductase
MNRPASRRNFLAAGLALPAVASASRSTEEAQSQAPAPARLSSTPSFQYRTLGKTGLRVTSVGFGCMITSDGTVVQRAADMGITYFDTARSYQQGNNERMVGAALKGKRKDIVLSTKTQARTKADALAHIDTSLKELGTDYVDIWYLHARTRPEDITDDLIEAQQEAKKAGKIRFAGVSTHQGHTSLIPFLAKHPKIDVILASYNFTMEPAVTAVIEEAAKAGKGVVAMKIMAGGTGSGGRGGRGGYGNAGGSADPNKLKQPGAMAAVLRWVLRNPNISTTVPSMTDMEQLEENVRAGSQPFSATDEKLLAVRREMLRPFYCNMCGKCEGTCREGLPVADVLRFMTYAEGYGQFALGRENFKTLSQEHANVKCAECPGCTVECPHGVQVAQRLIQAQELFAC